MKYEADSVMNHNDEENKELTTDELKELMKIKVENTQHKLTTTILENFYNEKLSLFDYTIVNPLYIGDLATISTFDYLNDIKWKLAELSEEDSFWLNYPFNWNESWRLSEIKEELEKCLIAARYLDDMGINYFYKPNNWNEVKKSWKHIRKRLIQTEWDNYFNSKKQDYFIGPNYKLFPIKEVEFVKVYNNQDAIEKPFEVVVGNQNDSMLIVKCITFEDAQLEAQEIRNKIITYKSTSDI